MFQQKFSQGSIDGEMMQIGIKDVGISLNAQLFPQKPIQLVRVNPNKTMQVTQQALKQLVNIDAQIAFTSLVGKYRTGKSFLLNKILDINGDGFKVDASTTACTQGIWYWGKPLISPDRNSLIFLMDTQGTQSTNRNATFDAKLFTLATLCSSLVIFNTVGVIDQISISQLGLVTALSKNISGDQASQQFISPKFLWLLRDFTLKLQDQRKIPITPTQYLEKCLRQQSKGRNAEQGNNIRSSIFKHFKDRQCLTMVRPVYQQSMIRRLNKLKRNQLRGQFNESVQIIRQKIFRKCLPKQVNGSKVSARVFADLLLSYVQSLNRNQTANVTSAWQEIVQDACKTALQQAFQSYIADLSIKLERGGAKNDKDLFLILKQIRQNCINSYKSSGQAINSPAFQKYENELIKTLNQKQIDIYDINHKLTKQLCLTQIGNLTKPIKIKLSSNVYRNIDDLQKDFNKFLLDYSKKAIGPSKSDILAEYLQKFNLVIFKYISDSLNRKPQADSDQIDVLKRKHKGEIQQYKNRCLRIEQVANESKLTSAKLQQDKRRANNQVITLKTRIKVLQQQLKKANQDVGCGGCFG